MTTQPYKIALLTRWRTFKFPKLLIAVLLILVLEKGSCDNNLPREIITYKKDPSSLLTKGSMDPTPLNSSPSSTIYKIFTSDINDLVLPSGKYSLQIDVIERGAFFVIPSISSGSKGPTYNSEFESLLFNAAYLDFEGVNSLEGSFHLKKNFDDPG